MKKSKLRLGIATALLVLTIALAFTLAQDSTTTTTDEEKLNEVSRAWDEAHNAGDVDELIALYTDDAVSMPFNRPALNGQAAIEADFRQFFSEFTAEHRTTIQDLIISGDWAIERGEYTFSMTPIAGGETYRETGKHIVVREKIDGEWKIVWEIWNTNAPPGE